MIHIINRYARIPAQTGDERLRDLGLDCLDLMSIALEIEDTHGSPVRDAEIESWSHVSCVARTVERIGGREGNGKDRKPSPPIPLYRPCRMIL